jgi:hypothetical protein
VAVLEPVFEGLESCAGNGLGPATDRLAASEELPPAADAAGENTMRPKTTATAIARTAWSRRVKRPRKNFRIIGTIPPRKRFGKLAMTLCGFMAVREAEQIFT